MALTPTVKKWTPPSPADMAKLAAETKIKREAMSTKMADPLSSLNNLRAEVGDKTAIAGIAKATPKLPVVAPLEAPMVEAPIDNSVDIQNQIIDTAKNAAITRFQNAFKNSQALATQQQADLVTDNRTQTGQLRTDDTMARAGTAKIQATQGLAGAGSASQTNTAQNVIQQGATSALTAQTNQIKADINAKLAEAQNARDTGIATAESEADITKLQNKLAALERVEATATANEAQAKADYLSTIGRFQGNYQAEIDRVLNDGDPTNNWQVPFLQTAREGKKLDQNLDDNGNVKPAEQGMISNEAQEALKNYNSGFRSQEIIDILTNAGYQFPVEATSGGYSSGGSTGGTSSTKQTDAQQVFGYNELKGLFAQGRVGDKEALEYLAKNNDAVVARFGQYAVDRMTQELITPAEAPIAEVEIPNEVQDVKGYTSYIDNYLVNPSTTDPYTGEVTRATVNVEGVKAYIRNLYQNGTINDVTADQLLSRYGL